MNEPKGARPRATPGPLWRVYWWLEPRLAPGLRFAQEEFEQQLFSSANDQCDWLDLGCGHALLSAWRAKQEQDLVGIPRLLVGVDPELDSLRKHRSINTRVCGDAGCLPFGNDAFDLVTANMVVEHLGNPEAQFREIFRILRPGGRFAFHTPNAAGYPTLLARSVPDRLRALGARIVERRGAGDRFPTFYRANSPARIREIATGAGFTVEEIRLLRSRPMFPLVPPLAAAELLLLRALEGDRFAWLRPNLIAVLQKPRANGSA